MKAVLVVDDEELLCEVTAALLEENGFEVLIANNGLSAEAMFKEGKLAPLVIIDFSMPGRNGIETFLILKGISPTLKGILTSGLKPTAEFDPLMKSGDLTFLPKPYREQELMAAVNLMLK